jgi:integrase
MASISTDHRGNRIVQFIGTDKKRRSIRLGKVDVKTARDVQRRIEALNIAQVTGQTISRDLADWLATIGDAFHQRLAAAGLIMARDGTTPELGAFLADFIARRATAKQSTTESRQRSADRLTKFFGAITPINTILPGQADEWLLWMTVKKKYARATIGRTVKHAKQFFRAAVRLKMLRENPFADLKAPKQTNEKRKFFVTPEVAAQVLDACPDAEWRLIFALCRFGGLRCPSEHLALRWADVDWDRQRFMVHAPKTEHNPDGGERSVPIFPELRPFLEDCRQLAPKDAVFVISRRRASAQRWGTLLERILAKAGIESWQRIFHNLRASRETELLARYPSGTVCRWLGNSMKVADAHYLMALETDFERAAREGALQKAVQQTATNGDKPLHTSTGDLEKTLDFTRNAKKHPEACKSQGG